jgi:hypothetical protein
MQMLHEIQQAWQFALQNVAKCCPVGHGIKYFSTFDVLHTTVINIIYANFMKLLMALVLG